MPFSIIINSTVSMNVRLNSTQLSEMAKSFKQQKNVVQGQMEDKRYIYVCDVEQ